MKEAFDRDVAFIVRCIRGNNEEEDDENDNEDVDPDEVLARSIACFSVSLGEVPNIVVKGRKSEPLVSFRYIAAAVCLREMDRAILEC